MIAELPGVDTFLDNMIIYSKVQHKHNQILSALSTRLRDCGFHLKLEKCHFYER